jgi:hypothetical protein
MNGNVDTDKFIQFVKIAQDIHIQNYLGTKLLEKLKSDITKQASKIPVNVSLTNAGTGYSTTETTTTAILPSIGEGLTLEIFAIGGIIQSVNYYTNQMGSGYNVGDVVTIDGGNDDATLTINSLFSVPYNYANLIENFVKPMLIHWAMVEYLPFAAYTIANKGVYKHSSENSENVQKNEVDFLIEKERQIAQHYTERFINYISFNNNLFPEYYNNQNGNMYPDSMNNYTGWYI